MSFTYDPTTALGKVRRTIPDKIDTADEPASFKDDEIQSYLDDFAGNWRLAAAQALDDRSGDELFVQKVQQEKDIKTDGAAAMKAYQQRIAVLRQQAKEADADANGSPDGTGVTHFRRRGHGCGYGDDCATELNCDRGYYR